MESMNELRLALLMKDTPCELVRTYDLQQRQTYMQSPKNSTACADEMHNLIVAQTHHVTGDGCWSPEKRPTLMPMLMRVWREAAAAAVAAAAARICLHTPAFS